MLFGMSKSDILCIDWDERSLRILEVLIQRSGPTVKRAVHADIPEGLDVRDPSVMGDFLRRTLGEHRIRTRRAIAVVPRQDTVLNRLSLPMGTMDEMAAMVHLQIAKELPFSKDQAVIDFAVVPNPDSPTSDVWVAAIRINVIEYYRQVFANSGVKLERMGLRPYANLLAVQALEVDQGRVLIVDVGPSMTEINILRDGALMYTRAAAVTVPAGAGASGDGDWAMDNLLIEVSRTIAAYRATDVGTTIDRIILSGVAGSDARFVQAFEDRFSVRTEIYSLPQKCRWKADTDGSAAAFSAAIGLALGDAAEPSERFDFLHVKEPEAEHRERAKRRPLVVATVALFGAAACVAAYQPIRNRTKEIEVIKATIALENRDQEQRTEALEKIADLKSWHEANVPWIDYLRELAAVFPPNKECYITQMEVNADKGQIYIKLAAKSRTVARTVVEAVESVLDEKGNPVFKAVPGNKADRSNTPDYPVRDDVTITVLPVPKR